MIPDTYEKSFDSMITLIRSNFCDIYLAVCLFVFYRHVSSKLYNHSFIIPLKDSESWPLNLSNYPHKVATRLHHYIRTHNNFLFDIMVILGLNILLNLNVTTLKNKYEVLWENISSIFEVS